MNRRADRAPAARPAPALPRGLAPWALAAVCIVLAAGGEPVRELARFDRAALDAGQLWRVVTGHVVHLGWPHTWLNVAALAATALLFGDVMRARDWLLGALLAAAAIDAGLYWLTPGIEWYVGLSGALHGLVLIGAARLTAVQPALGGAVLAVLAVKLGWEAAAGPLPWSEASAAGPVVVAAHLYGAAGAAAYLAPAAVRRVYRASL